MVTGPICDICSRPLYGEHLEVITFAQTEKQFVQGPLYCPYCLRQQQAAETQMWRDMADDLASALRDANPDSQTLLRYQRTREGDHEV